MRGAGTKQVVLFALLAVAITGFIFYNSAQYAQQSNAVSTGLMDWLRPLLEALFGSEDVMHKFVRKAAHFIEFAALGFCVAMVADGLRARFWRGSMMFFPLFTTLAVAVTDEFIQSFFDRTSAVKDIVLDFSGACVGIAGAVFALALLRHFMKRG